MKAPLRARVLLLETNGTTVGLVSIDACFAHQTPFWRFKNPQHYTMNDPIPPTLTADARKRWGAALGDPSAETFERLFVSATHAHKVPEDIGGGSATKAIEDLINDAKKKLRPARLAITTKKGRHDDWAFGSPGLTRLRRPNLEPQSPGAYPIDDALTILQVRAVDGDAPIAFLVNYGIHGTLSDQPQLDPDFIGEGMRLVEEENPGVVSLFVQGCCGDVGPVYPEPPTRRGTDYGVITAWGQYLANHVRGGLTNGAVTLTPAPLRMKQDDVKVTARPGHTVTEPKVRVSGLRLAKEAALIGVSGELFSEYREKIAGWVKKVSGGEIQYAIVAGVMNGYSGYVPTNIDFTTRKIMDRDGKGGTSTTNYGYEMSITPYTEAIERELCGAVENVVKELVRT